jgi:type IV pilus assembly protein PilN
MRLDINLATTPYEDAREFWVRWGAGVGVLAALTLVLLALAVEGWTKAGRDRHDIARIQSQIEERDKERSEAQGFLDMGANRSTRDQSQFLNGLIQRKAFSWTRVFEDMELVMPTNLHVVSLQPKLNDQNQMELEIRVVGENRNAAVELVHRMERSKHFQGAQLEQEAQSGEGSAVVALVDAIYVPDPMDPNGK